MTRGISEEQLKQYKKDTIWCQRTLQELIAKCTELNHWRPIDENTPKDREILGWILSGYRSLIHWNTLINDWIDNNGDYVTPTHWCELPDDPK